MLLLLLLVVVVLCQVQQLYVCVRACVKHIDDFKFSTYAFTALTVLQHIAKHTHPSVKLQ